MLQQSLLMMPKKNWELSEKSEMGAIEKLLYRLIEGSQEGARPVKRRGGAGAIKAARG